jgi:hypothetical protein
MATCGGGRRGATALMCAIVAAAAITVSDRAEAFELKHGSGGQSLRWTKLQVTYVVDPSMDAAASGGGQAVTSAVTGWEGIAGAPSLSTAQGKGGAKAGLDGQNTVLFAPTGFAPAGNALATTVTSYDEATGEIVDTDVVVNGIHAFAVLDAKARPEDDQPRVATDGALVTDDGESQKQRFDLLHVLSHEIGHTLGLADERSDQGSLMYAYTSPGDAAIRVPSPDDINGVDALYKSAGGSAMSSVGSAASNTGCGQSTVAAGRARPGDTWAVLALVGGAGAWLALRRRGSRVARGNLPVCAALAALVAIPAPPSSTHVFVRDLSPEAVARVVSVSTSNAGGLFETTLTVQSTVCLQDPCPGRASTHAWGGTLGGVTQQVGGEPTPTVGDLVHVVFAPSQSSDVSLRRATLLPMRR